MAAGWPVASIDDVGAAPAGELQDLVVESAAVGSTARRAPSASAISGGALGSATIMRAPRVDGHGDAAARPIGPAPRTTSGVAGVDVAARMAA